jgi:hypothetical protein
MRIGEWSLKQHLWTRTIGSGEQGRAPHRLGFGKLRYSDPLHAEVEGKCFRRLGCTRKTLSASGDANLVLVRAQFGLTIGPGSWEASFRFSSVATLKNL